MNNPLDKLNASIRASLCEVDITDMYFSEIPHTIFGRLCEHKIFDFGESYRVNIPAKTALVQISGITTEIEPQAEQIWVPLLTLLAIQHPKSRIGAIT